MENDPFFCLRLIFYCHIFFSTSNCPIGVDDGEFDSVVPRCFIRMSRIRFRGYRRSVSEVPFVRLNLSNGSDSVKVHRSSYYWT